MVYISREKRGLGHPDAYILIRAAVAAALSAERIHVPAEIGVLLTDDAGIRAVNKESRGVDAATDVLSFPFAGLTPGKFDETLCERNPETGRVFLGDMAISIPRCEVQGEDFGHGFRHELSYLAVHSVLHLLGYDHLDEGAEKRLMRSREKIIMRDLNV